MRDTETSWDENDKKYLCESSLRGFCWERELFLRGGPGQSMLCLSTGGTSPVTATACGRTLVGDTNFSLVPYAVNDLNSFSKHILLYSKRKYLCFSI